MSGSQVRENCAPSNSAPDRLVGGRGSEGGDPSDRWEAGNEPAQGDGQAAYITLDTPGARGFRDGLRGAKSYGWSTRSSRRSYDRPESPGEPDTGRSRTGVKGLLRTVTVCERRIAELCQRPSTVGGSDTGKLLAVKVARAVWEGAVRIRQDDHAVTVEVRTTGGVRELSARYLVGCDAAGSSASTLPAPTRPSPVGWQWSTWWTRRSRGQDSLHAARTCTGSG